MTDPIDEYAPRKRQQSKRIIAYGEPGVGKTTLGMQSSARPLFFSFDDGLSQFDEENYYSVPLSRIGKWPGLLAEIRNLAKRPALPPGCGSIVVDNLGDVQKLIVDFVCKRDHGTPGGPSGTRKTWVDGKADVSGYGYSGMDGWNAALGEWDELKSAFEDLQRAHDVHLVLIAHADNHKVKRAGGNDYSVIEPAIHATAASKMVAWADVCLYLAYEQASVAIDEKAKRDKRITTDRRIAYASPAGGAAVAKNRCSLDAVLPDFSWPVLWAQIAANSPEATKGVRAQIATLVARRRDPALSGRLTAIGTNAAQLAAFLAELQAYVATTADPLRAEVEATLAGEGTEKAAAVRAYVAGIDEASFLQKALDRRRQAAAA